MEKHPNIDSLRAFVADTLEKEERRIVLAHLAQCDGFRELVALMTPGRRPTPTSRKPKPMRGARNAWAGIAQAFQEMVLWMTQQGGLRTCAVNW